MSSSLSSLPDNLSEGLHSEKCADCKSCLDYMITKDDQLIFRCFGCKKNYEEDFNKELIKKFANVYGFCNKDINKFTLLLRKGVYPYEYMGSWVRFEEELVPDKKYFYSELTMEGIRDLDHRHAKRVFKNFGNKSLTLLLADVFENFRDQSLEIHDRDPAHFLTAPGLAWQACLKIRNPSYLQNYDANSLYA